MKSETVVGFSWQKRPLFFANRDMWLNNTSVFILLRVSCVLGPLREGENFFILGHFMRNLRDMYKKGPCKLAAFSIGALLGKLEGVLLIGLLREKKCISGFLFLDPEDFKSWSGDHLKF